MRAVYRMAEAEEARDVARAEAKKKADALQVSHDKIKRLEEQVAAQVKFIFAQDEEVQRLVTEVKGKDDRLTSVSQKNEGLQEALTNATDERRWLLKFGIPKVSTFKFNDCLNLRADLSLVFRFYAH